MLHFEKVTKFLNFSTIKIMWREDFKRLHLVQVKGTWKLKKKGLSTRGDNLQGIRRITAEFERALYYFWYWYWCSFTFTLICVGENTSRGYYYPHITSRPGFLVVSVNISCFLKAIYFLSFSAELPSFLFLFK